MTWTMPKPTRMTVPLTSLVTTHQAMTETLASRRATTTEGPVEVCFSSWTDRYEISDGHHRVAQAIREGRTHIEVILSHYHDDEPYQAPFYDFSRHMRPRTGRTAHPARPARTAPVEAVA